MNSTNNPEQPSNAETASTDPVEASATSAPDIVYQRRPRRSEEELKQASDEMLRYGATFTEVCTKYNIPISVLRFYMMRKGYLWRTSYTIPSWLQWRDEDSEIKQAAEKVDQGMYFCDASKKYNIPINALFYYMKDKGMLSVPERSTASEKQPTKSSVSQKKRPDKFFIFCNELPQGELNLERFKKLNDDQLLSIFEYMSKNDVLVDIDMDEDLFTGFEISDNMFSTL